MTCINNEIAQFHLPVTSPLSTRAQCELTRINFFSRRKYVLASLFYFSKVQEALHVNRWVLNVEKKTQCAREKKLLLELLLLRNTGHQSTCISCNQLSGFRLCHFISNRQCIW